MHSDISVIITTHNQPFEVVRRSLMSVLLQRGINFDLIIADDYSKVDLTARYEEFLQERGFSHYALVRHKENVKTVLNIARALSFAQGRYVKTLDAGDLLYSSDTLKQIVDFSEENKISVGFGHIVRFWDDPTSGQICSPYHAPRVIEPFGKPSEQDRRALLASEMETDDWIPAGAQFYRTEYYQQLLYQLNETYGVQYCQDFTSVLALADTTIHHLDMPIYWYEWGSGISTSGGWASRKRMYDDHLRFYCKMRQERPLGASLNRAYLRFRAKRLVALYTPLYSVAVKLARHSEPEPKPLRDSFFNACCQGGTERS